VINAERALVLVPRGPDRLLAMDLLDEAGWAAQAVDTLPELVAALHEGAGVALVADELLRHVDMDPLLLWVASQPSWSDFPFVVLTQLTALPADSPFHNSLQASLANVIFLDRPFHPRALVNVVSNALRGRRRQYQARRYLDDVRQSEGRLQTALLAGRMGSWELDIAELVLTGSDQFKANYGRRPGQPFLFADLVEAVALPDQRRVQRAMDDTIRTGADLVIEYRVNWPDGTEHWVEAQARVLADRSGQPQTVVGVSTEITERKSAEAEREKLLFALAAERERTQDALRGERALSELLMTGVPAGIVAYDTALRVTIWNPVMERLFGRAAPEVLGRPLVEAIGGESDGSLENRLREALAGVAGPVEEVELSTAQAATVVLESQHAPLRGGDGSVAGGAAFFRDITDRRRAEEQLRQAQKMETIGQLTGGVAHDFNNLLAAVQGNLELLRKRLPPDPQLQRFIDGAMQGAQRGASLTSRLLAFARRQDLRPEPTDLSGLLEGMRGLIERSVGPLITVEMDITPDLPPAKVDANQLELAILNLTVNARDDGPAWIVLAALRARHRHRHGCKNAQERN
jgi:PAS domain S-box-containing protein